MFKSVFTKIAVVYNYKINLGLFLCQSEYFTSVIFVVKKGIIVLGQNDCYKNFSVPNNYKYILSLQPYILIILIS